MTPQQKLREMRWSPSDAPISWSELIEMLREKCDRMVALKALKNYDTMEDDVTYIYFDDKTVEGVDISKEVEDQEEEVLNKLIEILS